MPGSMRIMYNPSFNMSTDKVEKALNVPAAVVLREIKVKEGATVQVNTVVGVIDVEGTAVAAAPQPPQPAKTTAQAAPAASKATPQADGDSTPQQPPPSEKTAPVQASAAGNGEAGDSRGVV